MENQGTNEDDSQSDLHPEAGIFRGQTTQNLGPKDCRDRGGNRKYPTFISVQSFPSALKVLAKIYQGKVKSISMILALMEVRTTLLFLDEIREYIHFRLLLYIKINDGIMSCPQVRNMRHLLSQYIREGYLHKERKGHPQIACELKETVSKL